MMLDEVHVSQCRLHAGPLALPPYCVHVGDVRQDSCVRNSFVDARLEQPLGFCPIESAPPTAVFLRLTEVAIRGHFEGGAFGQPSWSEPHIDADIAEAGGIQSVVMVLATPRAGQATVAQVDTACRTVVIFWPTADVGDGKYRPAD